MGVRLLLTHGGGSPSLSCIPDTGSSGEGIRAEGPGEGKVWKTPDILCGFIEMIMV